MMGREPGVDMNTYRCTVKIDSSGAVGGLAVTTKEELTAKRLGDCP